MSEDKKHRKNTEQAVEDFNVTSSVEQLLRVTSLFGDLLSQETQLLRQAKFDAAKELQTEKNNMTKLYQALVEKMSTHQDQVKEEISDDLRQNVIFARTEFTSILHKNLEAIENTKKTSQRIINRIIDSAREATASDPNYNAHGHAQHATHNAISISIDQKC